MKNTKAVAAICLLFASNAAAQVSSLQGRVVKWGTADPVAKATVELRRVEAGTPAPYVATSAADGTFVFAAVPPGQYRIASTRPGYVNAEYGQRWPNGAGTPLTIPPGRTLSNIPIPMLPTAAISGRVHDRLDQPIGNVEVQALKATYQDGRRVLTRIQTAVSDDRGEYRLFWLPPGRYYLSARHPDLGGGLMRFGGVAFSGGGGITPDGVSRFQEFRNSGDNAGTTTPIEVARERSKERERYVPVYFPGVTEEQSAAAIELAPGGEQIGMDFALEPVPIQHVRGRVVYESNGEPAMSARVQAVSPTGATPAASPENLLMGPGMNIDMPHTVQCCDGSFDMALPPGSYTVVAAVNNLNARVGVQVGYSDVDGVLLSLGRGFNVTGRVAFDGRAPTPAESNALRFSLAMNPPVPGIAPDSYSVVLPTGALTISAGRGDFRLNVAPLLIVPGASAVPPRLVGQLPVSNLYVKSVRLGDADVLNGGLHLEGPPTASLEVVIGTTPGSVEGVVLNENRQPVPNVAVSLLPDVARRNRMDLYKSTSTDANGRFKIERVPPGDYVAFSWDGIDTGDWQNPDIVAPYEGRGSRLKVLDNMAATVEMTAITPSR